MRVLDGAEEKAVGFFGATTQLESFLATLFDSISTQSGRKVASRRTKKLDADSRICYDSDRKYNDN